MIADALAAIAKDGLGSDEGRGNPRSQTELKASGKDIPWRQLASCGKHHAARFVQVAAKEAGAARKRGSQAISGCR